MGFHAYRGGKQILPNEVVMRPIFCYNVLHELESLWCAIWMIFFHYTSGSKCDGYLQHKAVNSRRSWRTFMLIVVHMGTNAINGALHYLKHTLIMKLVWPSWVQRNTSESPLENTDSHVQHHFRSRHLLIRVIHYDLRCIGTRQSNRPVRISTPALAPSTIKPAPTTLCRTNRSVLAMPANSTTSMASHALESRLRTCRSPHT